MPRGPKKRSRTDNKRLVGVRRIDAEPEDIATAIFDMALQDQEVSRALAPIPPSIVGLGKKGKVKDKIDKDDNEEEEKEKDDL